MKQESKAMIISLFVSTCLLWVAVVNGFGEEYEVLKGLKSVKAAFDVRAGNPKSAALTLKVIRQTYQDKNITAVTKNPGVHGCLHWSLGKVDIQKQRRLFARRTKNT